MSEIPPGYAVRQRLDEVWRNLGYASREEWIADRHVQMLASLTARQRVARWWSINWPAALTMAALLGVIVVLIGWMVAA